MSSFAGAILATFFWSRRDITRRMRRQNWKAVAVAILYATCAVFLLSSVVERFSYSVAVALRLSSYGGVAVGVVIGLFVSRRSDEHVLQELRTRWKRFCCRTYSIDPDTFRWWDPQMSVPSVLAQLADSGRLQAEPALLLEIEDVADLAFVLRRQQWHPREDEHHRLFVDVLLTNEDRRFIANEHASLVPPVVRNRAIEPASPAVDRISVI